MDCSGVKSISDPSIGLLNVTPSSLISANLSRLTIWNPPLSVSRFRGHAMNVCKPPKSASNGVPGCNAKWYVFPKMISGAKSSAGSSLATSCCDDKPFTVPLVPTGMNTGVRTRPCGKCTVPARA